MVWGGWYENWETYYLYEAIDPVKGEMVAQKNIEGSIGGVEVGSFIGHQMQLSGDYLCFMADNPVYGRFNLKTQQLEHVQKLKELEHCNSGKPMIYGNRMLIADGVNSFHVYEWCE